MPNNTVTFTINFGGNAVVNGEKITKVVGEMQGAFAKFSGVLDDTTQMFLKFNQFTEGVQNALSGLDALTRAGLDLNTSMTDLSALTGVTGDGLRLIERSARDLAKTFGGSAAQAVESYKLILSQLGPDIAQVPEALAAMGESVATLSKTMGGNTTAAADVLTTAMNQFGVSMEDPSAAAVEMARMMNVMAAAAQAGSAELPAIKEALQQSGMAAAAAGVSFEETNAAIQVLDQRGRKASEGGVALRNVLTTLSQGRFLPQEVLAELEAANIDVNTLTDTTRTLADRLQVLTPLMDDTALMTKLFGRENSNAAIALISGVDALRGYTEAVTDTRSAEEQAAVVMQSRQEQMARMTAAIEDAKIGLYDLLGGLYPVLKTVGEVLVPVAQLIPLINLLTSGLGRATAAVKAMTASLGLKTAAMRVAAAVSGTYRAALAGLTAALGSARIAAIALQATLTLGLSLAIQGVITLIQRLTQRKREERQATEALSGSEDDYSRTLVEARSRMSVLTAELRSFSGSKDEERAKVDELNSVYGDTFGTYETVRDWYDVLIARSGDYVQMMVNEARIRAEANRVAEASMKADSLQAELDATPRTVDRWLGLPTVAPKDNPEYLDLQKQLDEQLKIVSEGNASLQALVEENTQIKQNLSAPLVNTDAVVTDGGDFEVTAALSDLDAAFAQVERRNEIFGRSQYNLSDQIKLTASAITDLISQGTLEGSVLDALIAKYRELINAQASARAESIGPALQPLPEISAPGISLPEINMPEIRPMSEGMDNYGKSVLSTTGKLQAMQSVMSAVGNTMGNIAGSVSDGAAAWLTYGSNVLQSSAQVVASIVSIIAAQKAKQAADSGAAVAGAGAAMSSIPIVGPILAIAAMASMVAALMSIPKFAAGGIAYGPTVGMFGEYPGAASNPEVVAPLDRLQNMLQPAGMVGEVTFRISGRDLEGVLVKRDRYNRRTS